MFHAMSKLPYRSCTHAWHASYIYCRDAVMMSALETTVEEQPSHWNINQLDFVKELPRHTETSETKAAQENVKVAMNDVVKSFATMLESDQKEFKSYLEKVAMEEVNSVAEQHRFETNHKLKGMKAADTVMAEAIRFEQTLKGLEGLRTFQSAFMQVHKSMLSKKPNPPGISSVIDCNLMGDQLETAIGNTVAILQLNKELGVGLVLCPWDDSRALGTEFRTLSVIMCKSV